MATIIEGALWTLTDKAAERMAKDGTIYMCGDRHNVTEVDYPIYHISDKGADMGVGISNIGGYIRRAEQEVEV